MKRSLLISILAAGMLTLLSVPAGATTATQAKYIKAIRFLDPTAKGASNKEILKLGNSVCSDLKSGTSVKKLAGVLKGSEKADLVEATLILCPKYGAKVTTYYASTTTTVPVPQLTQQQKSAVAEAKQYLSTQAFSQQGLIDQLDSPDGGGYSANDATVAVDSLTTENWNNEAVQAAKQYLQTEPFSCNDLIQQLDSPDGGEFTTAQATYGAQQAGDCG